MTAQVVGVVLWHHTVRLQPLCECVDVIRILRWLAAAVRRSNRWDDLPAEIPKGFLDTMRQELSGVLVNSWTEIAPISTTAERCIFTDASNKGFGIVYTTMTGDLETDTPIISRVFRGGLKSSHIFIREAAAAIWGIRHALRRRHWRNVKIHLVTDNSAVAFALRSLYSSNDVVCGWIRQLAMELKDAGCTLEVEQVPSAMNPADPPSRLAAFDNDILQRG